MRYFGFADSFITMIRNLHRNITARFVVNGILFDPILVRTGIRQGCPLAPLLFLLVVEILSIALLQILYISTQIQELWHLDILPRNRTSPLSSMIRQFLHYAG